MKNKGFTLVEIIVVLVILALLAALLIPSLTGYIDKAREKKLTANCRSCVVAAQTLISEEYAKTGVILDPDENEVVELAEVSGSAYQIEVEDTEAYVVSLMYSEDGYSVKYERLPTPHYTVTAGVGWVRDTSYNVGDRIVVNGIHFECLRLHTSGTTAATRDPTVNSNKSTWQVTGFDRGADNGYSFRYRYAEGVVVTYLGKSYKRTAFNPAGGQTPSSTSSSDYWTLLE